MRVGQVLAQRFRIDAQVGGGGMGQVYRAFDLSTGEVVAAKVLNDTSTETVARFEREGRALARLSHPGIVRYVAYDVMPDGQPFLVMEWLEGEDLAHRLARTHLTVPETITLATAVADALGAAHAQSIVHRDLKPGNVFLVGGRIESPKILDFGIAFFGGSARITATGTMMGTPSYIAPEQARSGGIVDASADVFSLGCLLFECLSGRPPFQGDHFVAVLAKVIFEEAPRLFELGVVVPPWLDELVARMLSKEPTRRPRDGAVLARALEAETLLDDDDPDDVPPRSLGKRERRFLGVVLLGPPASAPPITSTSKTLAVSTPDTMRSVVTRFGAHLELLADGTAVVILDHTSVPTDIAAQVARCALALREFFPGVPIAVTTGWCELGRGLPVGEAIERALWLLHMEGSILGPHVAIDETTAGLLDRRFEIVDLAPGGFELRGERVSAEAFRPLLGKLTPCVGREHELTLLEQSFASAEDEPAALAVVITGSAGIGKSRLVHEFIERRKRAAAPVEILWGRGDLQRAGSTFGLLADVLWRAAEVKGGEPIEVRRERLAAFVARHVPKRDLRRVTEFLGELSGIPFPDEDSLPLRAARQDPELCGEQIRRAFRDFLRALCAERPALLVVEDVHWGDRASVSALEAALRELADEPILLVATARPEVDQVFPQLWVECGRQEIRLKHLSVKASARLARKVLGETADAPLVERLVALSEGHPFFLEELVRAASEGSLGESLPGTIIAMVQTRLERLEPRARRALRAASILGEVFWRGAVVHMVGEGDPESDPLAALVAGEICLRHRESRFSGDEEYAFRHALLREGAYALLTDDDRALGHRLAGEWLERAGEADPLVLAGHFERGGLLERAGTMYIRGAEQASARRNYQDAERYFARADELLAGLTAAARRARGLARFKRGRYEDAVTELAAAGAQAEAAGDVLLQVELLLDEGIVFDWMGDVKRAEERVLAAQARYVEGTSPLVDARLLLGLGRSSHRADHNEEAASELSAAAEKAARLGEEGYETRTIALLLLGFILPGLGRLEEAAAVLDEVIRGCEVRADLLHLGAALANRGLVRACRGDRAGLIADYEQTIAIGREIGQTAIELVGYYNLGEYLYLMDDLPAAEPYIRSAAALFKKPNIGAHPAIVRLLQARLAAYRGDEAEAAAIVAAIRAEQVEGRAQGTEILVPSEEVLCSMVELATTDAPAERWDELEERSARSSVGQERIEVLEARALSALRRGRRDDAARQLEVALDVASRVATVMTPRLRRALAAAKS
ncbi:serine/threonine-protein kinase [Polyangium sorediatum]|uniref:Protein kinase n=1 Tax=Polyangium sorediatum TaxID=889274 RepID=A0ABT6NX65_9BACT|nr:serine/threonine-protein kinase [Polyangium sorediatum]MDI1432901.1 protein kinase [Polyangium sorediatum]